MKKNLKSLISALLVLAIVCSVVPVAFAEDSYGQVFVNLKSQANGVIYMDDYKEARNTSASIITAADFLPSNDGKRSNLIAFLTSDVWMLENVKFGEESIFFAAPAKRKVSTDYSDKETIVLQPGGNKTVNVPAGHYKELYIAAMSVVTDAANAALSVKINYDGSSETLTQPVYDYKTTYDSLSSAVKLPNAHSVEVTAWNMSVSSQATGRYLYVYKIPTDNTKVLRNLEVTANGNATAIMGLTGNMNISKTKAYAEEMLAGTEAFVEENESTIKSTVAALVDLGIERSDIAGIEKLDNAQTTFVKNDIKAQANGVIYMDSVAESQKFAASAYGKNDFVNAGGALGSEWEAIYTPNRTKLSSVDFGGVTIPFDIAEKRAVSDDLTDKEAIIIKSAWDTKTTTVEIPDGFYKDIYFAAVSSVANTDAKADIKLNYNGSEETITQPIYGYNKTYTELSNAVAITNGIRIEMVSWNAANGWGNYSVQDVEYYVYKIPADNTKLLKNITITATDNATAILGITGNVYVDKTEEYLENVLAGSEDEIEANYASLNEMVTTLEKAGVDRSDIAGIENLKISKKAFVKVDVNAQANGIIYMDSVAESQKLAASAYSKNDFVNSGGALGSNWEAVYTSDRAKLSTVNFNGVTVPFDIAEKRAVSEDLTDKEAIIIKSAWDTKTTTVEIPDGYYKDIYFVAVSSVANDTAKADIKLNYNGSEETIAQPIYGYNKTYESLSNAVAIPNGIRIEMISWSATWGNYTQPGVKYYVYKISADKAKLLKNITITATDNVTAILGITGNMYVDETKAYAEAEIASGNFTKDKVEATEDVVKGLVLAGIGKEEISGIATLDAAALKLFGAMVIKNATVSVSGTKVSFSSVLENKYGADGEKYNVFAGLYVKGENKLAGVKPFSGTLGAGKTTDIADSFENVDTTKAYEIKYIVVKDSFEPLTVDVVKNDVTF